MVKPNPQQLRKHPFHSVPFRTPPGILTVKEAEALLDVTRDKDSEMLAYIAIGLFAGLRRSELCALEWSEIDRKARTIEVKGVKAKTRQRRIVSVSRALSAWLAVAPKTPRPAPSRNEDVCGERLKNLYSEERDESGTILREAIVSLWPHNALRHSFGSYHYARHRDENSEVIVTFNVKNFLAARSLGISILAPTAFLARMKL